MTLALGRPVTTLDDDARAVVALAASQHARLLETRSKLNSKTELEAASLMRLPFGIKPIGDGVDRFYADLAKL